MRYVRSPSGQIGIGMLFKGYSALTTACSPVVAGAMLLSARGRQRFRERFGGWGKLPDLGWWFHGASVGEVQGLIPLLSLLRGGEEAGDSLLTATSPTGLERGAPYVDHVRLLPLDARWCVRRALDRLTVQRLIVSETELWPILLHEVARRDIPAHVVNGRISDYTVRWYEQIESLVRPLVRGFRSICVPNKTQADRYIALGAQPEAVVVTGHSKYDADPRITSDEERVRIRRELFPRADSHVPIVVLGSMRPGEERHWFDAFASQRQRGAAVKMIVAPRHAEKFSFFSQQLVSSGLPCARWSERNTWGETDPDIVLLDTMGKLEEAYAVASLAFVGATLVDVGGHNPIEPAMYAVPVVVGPYISVVADVIGEMRSARGVIEVSDADGIAALLERVVRRDPQLAEIGVAGQEVWQQHRGAAQRIVSVVRHG